MTLEPTVLTAMIPFQDLAHLTEQYIRHVGVIKDNQLIEKMFIPVHADEENLVQITIHVLEQTIQ